MSKINLVVSYGGYASESVINAVDAISKADYSVEVANNDKKAAKAALAEAMKKAANTDANTDAGKAAKAALAEVMKIYNTADEKYKSEKEQRKKAVENLYNLGGYSVTGKDDFGFDVVNYANVFDSLMMDYNKPGHSANMQNIMRAVFIFGLAKTDSKPEQIARVSESVKTLFDGFFGKFRHEKSAVETDKDGNISGKDSLITFREIRKPSDIAEGMRAILLTNWKNPKFKGVFQFDGFNRIVSFPDWAVTEDPGID